MVTVTKNITAEIRVVSLYNSLLPAKIKTIENFRWHLKKLRSFPYLDEIVLVDAREER